MTALAGVRVIELANERIAYAGKLLADMGADVILVEPPAGDAARAFGPFAADEPGPDRSLWWWQYHTSKRGVTLDLESEADRTRFRALLATADILLESEPAGRLAELGLDYDELKAERPELVFVSMTPFGRGSGNAAAPAVDLTILAGGGPCWSCGYDDHTLPPVRGPGQGFHTACHFAAMSALTVAYFWRLGSGKGQFVDVLHARGRQRHDGRRDHEDWIIAQRTVQRQKTGRHAAAGQTQETQVRCAGRALREHRLPVAQPGRLRDDPRLGARAETRGGVP